MEGEDDIDNIFDEYQQILEGGDEVVNDDITAAQQPAENGEAVIPKRRIIRNPRIKFDANKLCGEKGLPILMDHFRDMKLKGKGHELADLEKLLSALEHWTHMLFPSMQFEDCLLQIEKLGKKKPVQTCVMKIRMDMPILAKDFIAEDNDDVLRNCDDDPPIESAFDQLLNENREPTDFGITAGTSTAFDDVENSFEPNTAEQVPSTSTKANNMVLSEEQKARIERNRQLAAERLKARMSNTANDVSNIQTESVEPEISVSENQASSMDLAESSDIPKKSKKRLRIESSSSEENITLDDLVEESQFDF